MRIITYKELEERIIIVVEDQGLFDIELFRRLLKNNDEKKLVMFLGLQIVDLEIVNLIINSSSTRIKTDSIYLSGYLQELKINHIYLDCKNGKEGSVDTSIDKKELVYFLNKVYGIYGKDFRNYHMNSIKKAIEICMKKYAHKNYQSFVQAVLTSRTDYMCFVNEMSVSYSSFFRDEDVFSELYNVIVPKVFNHAHVKIWSAGCSRGYEPYSIACLLKAYSVLDRSVIYATDFNENHLQIAKNGLYSYNQNSTFCEKMDKIVGKNSLNKECYELDGDIMRMNKEMKGKINFFKHDLTHDKIFNKFDIIFLRNVLIYFNDDLKKKVLKLIYNSLNENGYLILGNADQIPKEIKSNFSYENKRLKVYKKA